MTIKQKQLWISFVIFILLCFIVEIVGDIVLLCLLISLTIIKAWPVRPLYAFFMILLLPKGRQLRQPFPQRIPFEIHS